MSDTRTQSARTLEALEPGTWTLEPGSARAGFAVRSHGFATVHGTLPVLAATATVDDRGAVVAASALLSADGVETGNARRDKDLRRPRFLSSAAHPTITWTADRREQTGPGTWRVEATLGVRGTTTPLETTVEAMEPDDTQGHPGSSHRRRVLLRAVLDRRDIGIRAPRVLVARRVEITVELVMTLPGTGT